MNKSGIGVIVGDNNGLVIASLLKQIRQAYSPKNIEALAACTAIQFASKIGLREVVLEGD